MTLVVDASAVAEILLHTERGARAAARLGEHHLVAPQHLSVEVASVLRGWWLSGRLGDDRARQAFREFQELGVEQIDTTFLLGEVWALRHDLTAYDAMYVALARAAECEVLTLDGRLAKAAPDCTVTP